MEAKAKIKMVRISQQKANKVLATIRRKTVVDAFAILENLPNKVSYNINKLLHSAVSNAVENHGMLSENLFVFKAVANEGQTLKRFRPRAKGRADEKLKRTTSIEVVVSDEMEKYNVKQMIKFNTRKSSKKKQNETKKIESNSALKKEIKSTNDNKKIEQVKSETKKMTNKIENNKKPEIKKVEKKETKEIKKAEIKKEVKK